MTETKPSNQNKFRLLIVLFSIVIPSLVAALYFLPKPENVSPELRKILSFLPTLSALINGTTFILLILALRAIKAKNIDLHKKLMTTALVLAAIFLLSYVTYHTTTESTRFGGEGTIKYIYYFVLLSHILLSAVIVPLVLISYVRALSEKFDKHRKIARITLPIWLYVTLTGVIVYFMISPYY